MNSRAAKPTTWSQPSCLAAGLTMWLALAAGPAHAAQAEAPSPQSVSCAYAGWAGDGCKASKGSFVIADHFHATSFYDYAAQSGQQWAGGEHPWPWNSPGVDYSVGPAPHTLLQDPATALLPKGCVYLAKADPGRGAEIRCGAEARHPTLFGIDFSLHGCTRLVASGAFDGMITVSHSRFRNGPNCDGPQAAMIRILNERAGLALVNDFIDVDFPAHDAPLVAAGASGPATGPFVLIYSVVLNNTPRALAGNYAGAIDIEYNDLIGSAIPTTDPQGKRGELCELGCPTFPAPYAGAIFRNNVVVVPTTTRLYRQAPPDALAGMARPPPDSRFINDHNIWVVNYARGALDILATHLNGRVENQAMTLSPGYVGVVPVGATVSGLPGGAEALVVAHLPDGDYLLTGDVATGPFRDAVARRETALAVLVRVSYSAVYPQASVTDNYVDMTGAYSCVQDFGSLAGPTVNRGGRNLVTGEPITGITSRDAASACPVSY